MSTEVLRTFCGLGFDRTGRPRRAMLRATRPRPVTHPRWRTIMNTSVTTPAARYVRTGCAAAEILWDYPQIDQFRQLVIEATGRDCLHGPGETCPLLPSARTGKPCRADVEWTPRRAADTHAL